jgi:methyltransferase (TIGR00027 family)
MVLLGAGLDARAHRLPALAGFSVFELDHPATQGWKKQRVQPLVPIAARVAYVEADFEVDDDLDERLATAGYDATQPAAFVMEGVAMYLSARANDRVLAVAGNAAKGSKLAMTYFEPVPAPLAKALAQVLGGIREPVRTALSPDEAAALIGRHGFRRISDEGDPEWRARYDRRAQPWSLERLIVGERT